MIFAYLDPGSGFPFVSGGSAIWPIILTTLGFSFLFLKKILKFLKKFWWLIIILIITFIAIMNMKGANEMNKKVIILGIDAMDPDITEMLMEEGELPNFSYLKNTGSYSKLQTTMPSESVVCWTSLSTGVNPGKHGIFDFIMRDPDNYLPYLSLNEVEVIKHNYKVGPFKFIRKKIEVKTRNKAKNFWEYLSENNIPCYIYFCPNTFPAQRLKGRMLSGMGVPDLYGIIGRFSFYTTRPLTPEDADSRGKIVPVKVENGVIETFIYGPRMKTEKGEEEATVPVRIKILPAKKEIEVSLQGKSIVLKEKQWSKWVRVSFRTGVLTRVSGIIRFYLKEIEPEFSLYVSPVNFDPYRPLYPISYPENYDKKLARKLGLFYTQGMPHDTWALSEKRIDEPAFLQHVDIILTERKNILKNELKNFKSGVFFFYFDTLDAVQHMFWRYIDEESLLYQKNSPYKEVIYNYYKKMDEILGEVMGYVDENTILIVLSDHGFAPYRRSFNLNRWLLENGYLNLKEGVKEGKELFEGIDWTRTKAYAIGFGGIYINKIGRERNGIVPENEVEDLKAQIAEKLGELIDPKNGQPIVSRVYSNEEIFSGPYSNMGPDLYMGTNRGYRCSWKTALGMVPATLSEDNTNLWSGDHLIDPKLVPGVLFSNIKARLEKPSIVDITPTVLSIFNIPIPEHMDGEILISK